MKTQFITVLASHETSYRTVTINLNAIATIETLDEQFSFITLVNGRELRVMGTIADIYPNPDIITPAAHKIFENERLRNQQ